MQADARRGPSTLRRYGLAAALVLIALGLTFPLQAALPTVGYLFFYAAIAMSAWFGGKGAGWFAVIFASAVVYWVFIPPRYTLGITPEAIPVFIEFAASSMIASWFSSRRKQAETELRHARDELQIRVEERTAELRQTNRQLLAEMAERKRAEDAYYEAQAEIARVTRIGMMGALTASISHEINQPLTAVVSNADACIMWLSGESPHLEEARAALDCIAREATRASDVIRHIRNMFTKSAPERTSVQVNALISEVFVLMQPEVSRNHVVLETKLASDLPTATGDRVQLQQVLVNLVLNGIEAMSAVRDRPRLLVISSERRPSDEILVAVRDSGFGIDPKNEKRIFDAFFTSKPHGMGMGLAISHSIIEAHGGRLWASANSDYGATLQFTLPPERGTAP